MDVEIEVDGCGDRVDWIWCWFDMGGEIEKEESINVRFLVWVIN